jgi:hypothetical protein
MQIVRVLGRKLFVGILIAAAIAAVASSAGPLVVRDASARMLACVDIGCTSHQKCQDQNCDLCHTDNRCALVPLDN